MAEHCTRIKNIAYRRTDAILANLDEELKVYPDGSRLVDLRECEIKVLDRRHIVLRCFVHARDSGVFMNVGWMLNESVDFCLICRVDFSMLRRKHHCRACGTIVCNDCGHYEAVIMAMEDNGPVRVCKNCYRGQGEYVPALNTRHVGRSLKPLPAPVNPPIKPTNATKHTPNTSMSSNETPQRDNNNLSSSNRSRADSDSHLAPPSYLDVIPLPGYVVKTRRGFSNHINGNPNQQQQHQKQYQKVFINIGHHPAVHDPLLSLYNVVLPPDELALHEEEQRIVMNARFRDITAASPLDSSIVPILYLGEDVDTTQDKTGSRAALYWVLISSSYFQTTAQKFTSVAVVQKVIEAINITFKDSLMEEEYVRPRVKGGVKAGTLHCVANEAAYPVVFKEPFRYMLNLADVALLLRIHDASDTRSVYTARTALDLPNARAEDAQEQRSQFRLFFGPLPPFRAHNNAIHGNNHGGAVAAGQHQRSDAGSVVSNNRQQRQQYPDTNSEISDLTLASFNPHGSMPRKAQNNAQLPNQPASSSSPLSPSANGLPKRNPLPVPSTKHSTTPATTAAATAPGTLPAPVAVNNNNQRRGAFYWLLPTTGATGGDASTTENARFGANGRELLTANMLVYRRDLSLGPEDVMRLLSQSVKLPAVLVGWQIKLELSSNFLEQNHNNSEAATFLSLSQQPQAPWMIYVVTGLRKNSQRKTEFRISSLLKEDQWVLLKRSETKPGYEFTPLRQVLNFPK